MHYKCMLNAVHYLYSLILMPCDFLLHLHPQHIIFKEINSDEKDMIFKLY